MVCSIKEDRFFLCNACRLNVYSINFVGMSSLIFKTVFSFGSISNRDKKSAAIFNFPGMCAIVKLNCSTK